METRSGPTLHLFRTCVLTACLNVGGAVIKNPPANAGDAGLIPDPGRCPGEGNGDPLQVLLPGKPHGVWRATVHGVAGHLVSEQQPPLALRAQPARGTLLKPALRLLGLPGYPL